jgi:hypothetical protein
MNAPTGPAESPFAAPSAVLEPSPATAALPPDAAVRGLFDRGKNGAAWFYWVAGLSAVNTIAVLAEGGLRFALGLVVTMFGDAVVARELKPGGSMTALAIALAFNAFVLGLFIVCGRLSQRRMLPIYALGMALYLVDSIFSFLLSGFMRTGGGFIGIGIHAYALWCMWDGFVAYRQLNVLERQMMTMSAPNPGSV